MSTTQETVRVDNLLNEIKYAFHAERFSDAELMASELHTMIHTVRKVSELVTLPNEKKAS